MSKISTDRWLAGTQNIRSLAQVTHIKDRHQCPQLQYGQATEGRVHRLSQVNVHRRVLCIQYGVSHAFATAELTDELDQIGNGRLHIR
ncbi:hypothetical protein D3C80_1353930 [compost metagenome]